MAHPQHANPIILDSAGRATVYLGTLGYKFQLFDSASVLVFTQDNVISNYTTIDGADTLSNKTLDDTTTITIKDSLFVVEAAGATTAKFRFGAGLITPGNTRVILVPDSGFTLAGIDLQNVFTKRQEWGQGANVASAGDLTLGLDGNVFRFTGSTTINAITTANWTKGSIIILLLQGALTLKHNTAGSGGTARLSLQNGLDFNAGAGDAIALYMETDSGVTYFREIARSIAGTGIFYTTKVVLTNAQVLALPTTAVQVIAAPGSAGKHIQLVTASVLMDLTAAVYTNVDAGAVLGLITAAGEGISQRATKGLFNASAAKRLVLLEGGSLNLDSTLYSNHDNQAIKVSVSNGAAGNFTGGDAANTMTLFLTYQVVS